MKNIKEASTKKEVNSYLTGDNGDIVTLMEQEWPLMTAEFRRLQRNNMSYFYTNNMIMAQAIFQLEHNYKLKMRYIFHLQDYGLE